MNHSLWTADAATFRKIFGIAMVAATIVVAVGAAERETSHQSPDVNKVASAVRAERLISHQPVIIVSSLD